MWIINDWHAIFESAESRRWKKLAWIRIPNAPTGRGFRRLMRKPGGVEAFGCFMLMVEAASRMQRRGVLVDQNGALGALELEDMMYAPAEAFEAAFGLLSAEEIRWISWVDEVPPDFDSPERIPLTTRAASLPRARHLRAASIPENPDSPVQTPSGPVLNGITQGETDFALGSPGQKALYTGLETQVRKNVDAEERISPPQASDTQVHELSEIVENVTPESLARMGEELEDGLLPVTPASRKRPGLKPSRNEVTRMAQALQTYAQHLTHRPWPLPDWPLALKAAGICHPHYTQAEEALRNSALAKRPRGSNTRVDMQTYGLPITILESAFSKRSQ